MKLRNAIVAGALALLSLPAFADIVEITNVSGAWFNAVPPPPDTTITNGTPLSSIRWGDPAAPNTFQSGYDYTAVSGAIDFTVNPPPVSVPPELLGTFNHLNFPIFPPNLESVQLDISADVAVNAIPQGTFQFIFDFTHDETPNGGPPGGPFSGTCPYPTAGSPNGVGVNVNGCADKVTVSFNTLSQEFIVGGVHYTLDILGFSQDGGATITNSFITTENQNNTAGLYAQVRAVTPPTVPEPMSLALVGLGLLAAGFVRRKSNR